MSVWYRKVTANLSEIVDTISHFEKEIDQARFECGMKVPTKGGFYVKESMNYGQ